MSILRIVAFALMPSASTAFASGHGGGGGHGGSHHSSGSHHHQ
jgi:hypothetical protein